MPIDEPHTAFRVERQTQNKHKSASFVTDSSSHLLCAAHTNFRAVRRRFKKRFDDAFQRGRERERPRTVRKRLVCWNSVLNIWELYSKELKTGVESAARWHRESIEEEEAVWFTDRCKCGPTAVLTGLTTCKLQLARKNTRFFLDALGCVQEHSDAFAQLWSYSTYEATFDL